MPYKLLVSKDNYPMVELGWVMSGLYSPLSYHLRGNTQKTGCIAVNYMH